MVALRPRPMCSPCAWLVPVALLLGAVPVAAQSAAELDVATARQPARLVVPPPSADREPLADPGLVGVVSLALPDALPESFVVPVAAPGHEDLLSLTRHTLRGPQSRLVVWDGSGYTERELPPVTTYRGTLRGDPGATVLASLTPAGLSARILPGSGRAWTLEPLAGRVPGATRAEHALSLVGHDHPPLDCGAEGLVTPSFASLPTGPLGGLHGQTMHEPPACMERARLAFDADYEYYLAQGADLDATVARIEGHMNQVEFFYARDAAITYRTTRIVVRTAPFYAPTGGGNLLDLFRAEWEGPLSHIPRDMAHLMTGKPGSLVQYGGLAWVGVVCTSLAYGWSMDSAGIVGHELGHNWASGHCHDTTPCNNMCGACLFIGPATRQIILAHKESRDCLTLVPEYSTPLPPYTAPDAVTVRKDDLDGIGAVAFDVLANDSDGNCQSVLLGDFDSSTPRGGTVTVAPGGDVLLYAPPAVPFVGTDSFDYTARDHQGQLTSGTATLTVRPNDLAGYWRLDDGAGTVAEDATSHVADGTLLGAPVWSPGTLGGALDFDGIDDDVVIPAPHLSTDQLTITAWIQRSGGQGFYTGLVFCRAGSTVAGLNIGIFNQLGYHWNDDSATYTWLPGLTPPDGAWVFVALVVEPNSATIWMHDGTTLQSATNVMPHDVEAFDGELHIGTDPASSARTFTGLIDDVRVYDHALDAAAIADLAASGGRAEAPYPLDGSATWSSAPELTWAPAHLATLHDVYLGTDYAAVRDATTASPEYQGAVGVASYSPGPLAQGTEVFWRVDETVGPQVFTGRVWQFTPPAYHHWRLDESSGTVATDAEGSLDGTYFNGPLLGEPGATGVTGTSVYLDGINDGVRTQAPNLDSNRVTIVAWVRRDGAQDPWSGIVFSRNASTVSGLNFGENQELRYHWDGGHWGWDSGLVVPDDTWVFTALVVEPDQATIWLGQGGVLTSATNVTGHAVEAWDGLVWIGRDSSSSARRFQGWVDEVRIYDAALSPADIHQLYAASQ